MKPGDDEPIVAEIEDKGHYRTVRGLTTKSLGASKVFHADCPCCGHRFAVEHHEAELSILDREEQSLKRKFRDRIQQWFTENWGWKTHEREHVDWGRAAETGRNVYGANKSKGISSDSIKQVFMCGAGKSLHSQIKRSQRKKIERWFSILWYDADSLGEMVFAARLCDLFEVLQGIADDAPEFAYRLRRAADNALKRDGSAAGGRGDDDVPTQRREGNVEPFNDGGQGRTRV